MRKVLTALALLALAAPLAAQEVNDMAELMSSLGGGLTGAELKAAIDKAAVHPLGSKDNPVRADGPTGQRAYLKQLRCPDGKTPGFHRQGNVGPGIYGYIIDAYEVDCDKTETIVYMDMYHRHSETAAVPGFTIEGAPVQPAI